MDGKELAKEEAAWMQAKCICGPSVYGAIILNGVT